MSQNPSPKTEKYEAKDGGGKRINHRTIAFSQEWSKHHQQAWTWSKLYDENYEQWKTDQANWKAWVAGGKKGRPKRNRNRGTREPTLAAKRAALQAQLDALV